MNRYECIHAHFYQTPAGLDLDLSKAQNLFFAIGMRMLPSRRFQSACGREKTRAVIEFFARLGDQLQIRIK